MTPSYGDLNWSGLDFSRASYQQVSETDAAQWKAELNLHSELFQQLAHRLPVEMTEVRAKMERRLAA